MEAVPTVVRDASAHLASVAADAKKRNRALPRPDVIVPKDNPSGLDRRKIVVRLFEGPCDGQFATLIGYSTTCWQRVPGSPGGPIFFAKYDRSARGEFTFANEIMDQVGAAEWVAKHGRERVMGSNGA